jgi:2-polyprenyl-3-methyl-5-hydroxy-6-metoxy-1,4-benzoquinol methylase
VNWTKHTSLVQQGENENEQWVREYNGKREIYDMAIYLGKKTNLLKLKKNIVSSIKNNVSYYKKTREALFSHPDMQKVSECPVCRSSSAETTLKANIYGAEYVQCQRCTHVYLIKRPAQAAIHNFYLNDVTYAATYTDKKSAEDRMNTIAVPWVKWTLEVYEKRYGCKPSRILDVGSGAGHFVEACRRMGIHADGIELSESSRNFARDIWGFEMDGRNILEVEKEYLGYDVVTFWGLLEHTPNPGEILKAAYNITRNSSSGGMVISKLPRWNSLSSAIQTLHPAGVIRHLDPMGHIMAFTDASAAELYHNCGFAPTAAWYYGMDVYEMLMQIGNEVGNYDHLTKTGDIQIELQQFVDEVRFSDGLTLVGVPQ